MESTASTSNSGVDVRDLQELLGAFGPHFSLEDIASAYFQANYNINVTAEILFSMNDTTLATSIDTSKDKLEGGGYGKSLKLQSESENPSAKALEPASDKVLHKPFKLKNCPVAMGTISTVIGKEYLRGKPLTDDSHEPTKPMKLNSKEFPASEIWSEEVPPSTIAMNGTMRPDIEEFLFKMLGDGFQLDTTVIRDVLGQCGYDAQKSVEKLIDLSASTLEVCDDFVDMTAENFICQPAENFPGQKFFLKQEQTRNLDSAQSDGAIAMRRNLTGLPTSDRDRIGLQKEIIQSLFIAPERSEEGPIRKIIVRPVARRSRAFGKFVKPYKDTTKKNTTVSAEAQEKTRDEDEDDENSFDFQRKAVKEYWFTMKEYYKFVSSQYHKLFESVETWCGKGTFELDNGLIALNYQKSIGSHAFDAFAKGDYARANKLLQQGQFFNQKAREADEKSAQRILQVRDDEVLSLDSSELEPKEAIRLLRTHLTSLGGIPSIKYLRVIVGTNDEDTTKGARKRMILKQLEKESIEYEEEENGQAILIRVDKIDPKRLSFAKNKMKQ
ncbi:hypothetical protein Q3G72_014309 [Acer saccharum]|nr:hypothetical protein Q3G72_014309 [Acer saccharum]